MAPPRTLAKQEARKQVRLSKRDLYVLHHLDRDLEEIIEMRAYQAVAKKIAEFELTEKDLENFVPKGYSLLHSLFSTFCAQWTPIEQENN